MSEDGPRKLGKPIPDNQKKDGLLKLRKPNTDIRKRVGSLKLKKPNTAIGDKIDSLKLKKSNINKKEKEGHVKLRRPDVDVGRKSRIDYLKNNNTAKFLGKNPIFSVLGLIIIIILIVSVAIWAVGNNNPVLNNSTNTTNTSIILKNQYNDGNISFDYPEGWNITNTTNQPPLIVTVEHNKNNSFSVFKEDLGTRNFTQRVAQWRSNIVQKGMIYYEGDLTIDGIRAYELEANYKPEDKIYTTRGIAFQKNNTVYFIIFIFDKPLLDYKNEMDKVINSFHVTSTGTKN